MGDLYTVKQLADILGFSTNTVYKYLNSGAIHATRAQNGTGRFRVSRKALEEFLGAPLESHSLPASTVKNESDISFLHEKNDASTITTQSSSPSTQKMDTMDALLEKTFANTHAHHSDTKQNQAETTQQQPNNTQQTQDHNAPTLTFALVTSRTLFIICLLAAVVQLVLHPAPHPLAVLSQLLTFFIFLLLLYQFGGLKKKRSALS